MAEKASPDRHISVKEMECLKEAFALFDRDRDGEISTEELGKVRCEVRECLCVELVSLSWILAHWKRQFESQQRFVKNRCLITRGFWYKTTRTSCATDKQAPHRTRMSMLILFLAMTNLTLDIKWSDIWDCWPTNIYDKTFLIRRSSQNICLVRGLRPSLSQPMKGLFKNPWPIWSSRNWASEVVEVEQVECEIGGLETCLPFANFYSMFSTHFIQNSFQDSFHHIFNHI